MTRTVDGEGAHVAAILRAADFRDRRVLEVGCGDGRLTRGFAPLAANVLAFDPAAEEVARAESTFPVELAERVRFRTASAEEIEIAPVSIDLVLFSWSL